MWSGLLSELTGGFSSGEASLFTQWGQPEFGSDIGGKVCTENSKRPPIYLTITMR